MAGSLMDVFVKIGADTSGLEEGINKTKNLAGGIAKGFATATAAVGAATVAAGSALVKGTADVAAYGDNIDKMSQKMGLSAEAYQEWDAVMQHSGTSMETMKASMKTLANAVETGNEAFEKIGLSQEQLATMSQEDIFEATIAGLQNVEDTTERTYLAGKLLGKGATELGALLNTSAEDTQAMRDRVHELGGVMSNDAVKAAAAYQDQLQDMTTAFDGLKRGLVSDFMPSITQVMSGLTEIFSGNYDEGLDQISKGIDSVVSNLTNVLPKMLEVGVKILESLAKAILENIPKLLPTLVQLVVDVGKMIIENLPLLLETGFQIILELANGIAEALPELIPTIVEVVLAIVDMLIDNVDMLVDAAIALMTGLAEGLINALPIIIEKLPEIIEKIVTTLIDNLPVLVEAVFTIMVALGQAIIENIPQILAAIVEIISGIIQKFTEALPEIKKKGTEVIEKLIAGIKSMFSKLKNIARDAFKMIKDGIKEKLNDAKNWGRDLISNFIGGIKEKWDNLKDTLAHTAEAVKSFLGFSEPEEGPLSNFHTYAPDMMRLFAKGVKDNKKMLLDTVADAFDFGELIDGRIPESRNRYTGSEAILGRMEGEQGGAKQLTVILQLDRSQFAKAVYKLNNEEVQRVGVNLAGGYTG